MRVVFQQTVEILTFFLGGVVLGALVARLLCVALASLRTLPRHILFGLAILAVVCAGYSVKPTERSRAGIYSEKAPVSDLFPVDALSESENDDGAVCVIQPDDVDVVPSIQLTNVWEDCELYVCDIEVDEDALSLGVCWKQGVVITNAMLDVFACSDISVEDWALIAAIDITGAQSNVVASIPRTFLPSGLGLGTLFIALATQEDSDGDGFSNAYEWKVLGTNPYAVDSDGDGLSDDLECQLSLDPASRDTDGDGLDDGSELVVGTDPLVQDSDGDGLLDSTEVLYTSTNPLEADSNGDGTPDGQEFARGGERADENLVDGYPPMEVMCIAPDGVDGPSFSTEGFYSINITYSGETTGDFSVLGISPPGGSASLADVTYDVTGPGYCNAFSLSAGGALFRPLKTGWFSFQVEADDSASLHVGSVVSEASWGYDNPGHVASGVFIAGRSYPIQVSSTSIGGPAKLAFPRFGEYSPIERPTLAAGLSKNTMIFEESYDDAPGARIVPPQSANVYALRVSGGYFGGTLTLAGNGLDALENISGARPPDTYAFAPGETCTWIGRYWARQPSATLDDKEIIATFMENETGETLVITSRFTVVKLSLSCVYGAPKNPCVNRHVVGVGEKIVFGLEPNLEGVSLVAACLNDGDIYGYHNSFGNATLPEANRDCTYVCPASASQMPQITVSFRGQEYHPQIVLVEPESVECRKASWNGACFLGGEVGVGMLMTKNYIKPYKVSFQGILVAEIPCYSAIPGTGYFVSPPDGSLTHCGAANHLWQATRVGEGNYWTTDQAGRSLPYPYWSEGRLDWKIPIGWFRRRYDDELSRINIERPEGDRITGDCGRSWLIGGRDDAYLQTFEIDSNGGASISKHGHKLFRSQNCRVILDGRTIQLLKLIH